MKKIAVLTSGGDAPGMNPCIRAVVRTADYHKVEVYGVGEGFRGLVGGDFRLLNVRDVGGILQRGGTVLRTARLPEFTEKRNQVQALRELNERGVEGLIVIGGDGSMRGAHALAARGFQVIGIPGSIDNDMFGTAMSLGVDTAMNTIMEAVDKLRDTASSHQRAFLVETMGRSSGYLALMAGVICGAEMILIPENDIELDLIARTIGEAYARGKTHAILIVAEGAKHKCHDLAAYLDSEQVGFTTRVTTLGHVQRGGSPSAFDRMLATRMGVFAVEQLIAGESDQMVGLLENSMRMTPLEEVASKKKSANLDYLKMAVRLAR